MKMGDAMGRPSWGSSFLGDPGTKFFVENGAHAQNKKKTLNDQEQSERPFYSCLKAGALGRATGASIPTVEPGTPTSYLPRRGGSSRERKLVLSRLTRS